MRAVVFGELRAFLRTPEVEVAGKGPSDGKSVASIVDGKSASGKSFKEPVADKPKLSDQGLYCFNLLTFGPRYNTTLPFYFQTGLVYTGLIPSRDKDLTMFSLGFGSYSFYNIEALQEAGKINQPNYTAILEWVCRSLRERAAGYRYALERLVISSPSSNAVEAERSLRLLTTRIDGYCASAEPVVTKG